MKKLIISIILLSFVNLSNIFCQNSSIKNYNNSFGIRPFATIVSSLIGASDLVIEAETAFSKTASIKVIDEFTKIGDINGFGLNIGPQYTISGSYLDGLKIGFFPGIMLFTSSYDGSMIFPISLMSELSYQHIFNSGFYLGAYIGYSYILSPLYFGQIKYGAIVGFSYEKK